MFMRAFHYSRLVWLLLVLASIVFVYAMGWFGGIFFDFISRMATVDYLKSDCIRLGFRIFFALAAIGLLGSFFARRR